MKFSFTKRGLLTLAALVATLAVPTAAQAHPSVFEDVARTVTNPAGPAPYTLANQTRYVVSNHGFTYVARESNGLTDEGVMDYKFMPNPYRNQLKTDSGIGAVLAEGDTGAQSHATCQGVPALETVSAITGWQGADPFYNYLPFQKASAGLEDNPADWIGDVQTLTAGAVDLSTVSDDPAQAAIDLATLCSGLGGTFTPADAVQTVTTALASGTIAEATEPLEEEIDELTASNGALTGQKAALEARVASLSSQLEGWKSRIDSLKVKLDEARKAKEKADRKIKSLRESNRRK